MKEQIVKKIQIAQAQECAHRATEYQKGLEAIVQMCEIIKPIGQYNKMPDDFKMKQRLSMKTIINDLKSMKAEATELAKYLEVKSLKLSEKRQKQLEHKNG